MAIKPIDHYSITNIKPSVYDEEGMTALELVGRIGQRLNEAIAAYNELEKSTGDKLTEYNAFIQVMNDENMPENVKNEVNRHINNGDFDKAINLYIGNLEERLDNLLSSIPEGSTTMDAELVDIRTGKEPGENYDTAGAAVRAKANLTEINRFFESDIISNQSEYVNYFADHSFKSNGNAGDMDSPTEISITPGRYNLVVTATNADRLIIAYRTKSQKAYDISDASRRLLDIVNPTCTSYSFTVPDIDDDLYLFICYGSGIVGSVKDYYFKRSYVFKGLGGMIPPEFVGKGSRIVDCSEVITQKGENLYNAGKTAPLVYDGVSLNVYINRKVYIQPGNYLIRFGDGLPRVIITTQSNTRIFDQSNMPVDQFYKLNVPAETTYINIAGYLAHSTAVLAPAGEYSFDDIVILEDNGKPFLPDYLTRFNEVKSMIETAGIPARIGGKYHLVTGNISANGKIEITEETHVKKNYSIVFNGTIGTFAGLRIGQGKTSYSGAYMEITPSQINLYTYYTSAQQVKSVEHGLTISDFINVNINAGEGTAKITLSTSTGSFTLDSTAWAACNGLVFAESMGGTFTACKLSWACSDLNKKVWIFGDSYLGMTDARLIGQLFKRGYHDYLASGYPGATSSAELTSLKSLLNLATPNVIIWCLGMNNGDNGAINSSWLSVANELASICENKGIELIFTTIPNVPAGDHTYKNEWIRQTAHRFIDFNKAVNISGNTWYDGMLHSDNVHPTELGASVLADRMILDAPEIMVGG